MLSNINFNLEFLFDISCIYIYFPGKINFTFIFINFLTQRLCIQSIIIKRSLPFYLKHKRAVFFSFFLFFFFFFFCNLTRGDISHRWKVNTNNGTPLPFIINILIQGGRKKCGGGKNGDRSQKCQCPAISDFNGIEVALLNLKFVHVLGLLLNGCVDIDTKGRWLELCEKGLFVRANVKRSSINWNNTRATYVSVLKERGNSLPKILFLDIH